ncbi:MAG: nitrous oxide reductase family maturation protein NosD [Candidatus Hodarchaeota archaeon]
MKIKSEIFIIISIALFVSSSFFISSLNSNLINVDKNIEHDEIDEINGFRSPKKSWFNNSMDPIFIDNSASNNWAWALSQEWCRLGDGSWGNPYIIENITIDAGGSGSGILIENSLNVYFKIKNCTVYNSGTEDVDAGIKLNNTNNGEIINNTCSLNYKGIFLIDSNNNTVSNNTVNNNGIEGIKLGFSDNNTISGNTANNNINGIYLATSNNNTVSGNIANNNDYYGIILEDSNYNKILGNTIEDNGYHGIVLMRSDENILINNNLGENLMGIILSSSSGNTAKENTFVDNSYGIILSGRPSSNNTIYLNSFKGSLKYHAGYLYFSGSGNSWDNGSIGNYWDDYIGVDDDDDFIGDTPYNKNGVIDNYPIWNDGIHIDDNAGNNWEWASTRFWCSGSGTPADPYVIDGLEINAGGSGSGIIIENSNAYFRIENCIVYHSGSDFMDAGIKFYNTNNGTIINNDCSLNENGIHLEQSNNNTISGNTAKNNDLFGISLWNSYDNTVSGNTANSNSGSGIYLLYSSYNVISGNTANNNLNDGITVDESNNNTVSGNTVNNNNYGIYLYFSNNNTISGNTVNNNNYGIYLYFSNNNTISGNTLVGNIIFIYEYDGCIENIIKDNTCYTIILPPGINEFEIEPYSVDNIDVNISIALNNYTEVIFSAFDDDISEVPLDKGLIFMNLQLNDTDNLNQKLDTPINITLKYDVRMYKILNAFWFNESANGGQGGWVEIPFSDNNNGIIVISLNHTSLFALNGELKTFPLSKDDDGIDEINIIVIFIIIICSLSIITAASTYYYKTRAKPTKKELLMKKPLVKPFDEKVVKSPNLEDYVEKKNLLRVLKEKNALEKPALFDDLNITVVSNEFWEKIVDFNLDDKDKVEFIKNMLSFTPKERQEIIDGILKLKESNSENTNQQSN